MLRMKVLEKVGLQTAVSCACRLKGRVIDMYYYDLVKRGIASFKIQEFQRRVGNTIKNLLYKLVYNQSLCKNFSRFENVL